MKVTESLNVNFTEFVQVFIFDLNLFSKVQYLSSLGRYFYILKPTKAAVSVPDLTVGMFCDLNRNSFLKGRGNYTLSKTSFVILGVSVILTLNISISNFCKLWS